MFDQLESDLFKKLTPAEVEFIDARARRDNAPEVEWFFNNKKFISDSGYYDVTDEVFDRFSSRVSRVFDGVTTYSDLKTLETSAAFNGDVRTHTLAKRLLGQIDREVSKRRENMRRRNPQLDAALWHTGRTSTIVSRGARDLIPAFELTETRN